MFYIFDDLKDPFQLNNLAGTPEVGDIQKKLEQELSSQLKKINDPFKEKEYYIKKWGYEIGKYGEIPYKK